jgi:hypothetical protein
LTPHDAVSNKVLVYRARNALVAIGYAGVAYVQGVPTDQWIAEKLWGEPLPSHDDRTPMVTRTKRLWRDIGLVVRNLQQQIASLAMARERVR